MTEAATKDGADTADWVVCAGCGMMIYRRRLARNLEVCPDCGRHGRLTAAERLRQLLDPGTVRMLDPPAAGRTDPLGFADARPYTARLAEARRETGLDEAVLCARGAIEGHPVIAAVMDFRFLGGSLGWGVGERLVAACDLALRTRTPLLIVSASGGARMQEGAISLMQMARTSAALHALDEAGVLTISLITDPTFGGVAASHATLCDVLVAEPGARLGFAGPRVIAQTIGGEPPPGFQTAEYLFERGLIDVVRPRGELRPLLARLLSAARPPLPAPPLSAPPLSAERAGDAAVLVTDPVLLPERDPWELVGAARSLDRPTTYDHIGHLLEEFEELHGDRQSGDSPAIVGGLGVLRGMPLVVIGHQKGGTLPERQARSFGMAAPDGYRKAARLMRLAAKLGLPVLTFVDTPGAHPGVEAEERGQAVAIAENLRLMAGLPVPVVSLVIGEGGSGGALGIAVADRVLICENAYYSVISPEGCAAILWRDPGAAREAAGALRLAPRDLLAAGVVDGVLLERDRDPLRSADRWGDVIAATLRELAAMDTAELLAARRGRLERFSPLASAPAPAER